MKKKLKYRNKWKTENGVFPERRYSIYKGPSGEKNTAPRRLAWPEFEEQSWGKWTELKD